MRLACLRIPDFAVWALRRHDPTLHALPVVVGGIPPERSHVVALSPEARGFGLRVGVTLCEAQSLLPEAHFARLPAALEQSELAAVRACLGGFSPTLEGPGLDSPSGARFWFLDLRGLGRLHATESIFAERVRTALRARGYPSTLGIASTKLIAQLCAQEPDANLAPGVHSVPPGGESTYLAPLPFARLPADPGLRAALDALGIHTVGAWTALDPQAVAARFGAQARRLHARARADATPLAPRAERELPAIRLELEEPTDDLERFTFHLKQAVDALVQKLGSSGLAVSAAQLELDLEDRTRSAREARFVRPTLAPRLLLDCLRLALQREPLGARILSFALHASQTSPARAEQLSLFAERAPADTDALEAALARLRALLGTESVACPLPADSHLPEARIAWEPFSGRVDAIRGVRELPRAHPQADIPPGPWRVPMPTRRLAPPLKAQVTLASGRPRFLASDLLRGPVLAVRGPYSLSGDWWARGYARRYYTVTLSDGARGEVYRDLADGQWYLHGAFD